MRLSKDVPSVARKQSRTGTQDGIGDGRRFHPSLDLQDGIGDGCRFHPSLDLPRQHVFQGHVKAGFHDNRVDSGSKCCFTRDQSEPSMSGKHRCS